MGKMIFCGLATASLLTMTLVGSAGPAGAMPRGAELNSAHGAGGMILRVEDKRKRGGGSAQQMQMMQQMMQNVPAEYQQYIGGQGGSAGGMAGGGMGGNMGAGGMGGGMAGGGAPGKKQTQQQQMMKNVPTEYQQYMGSGGMR
jgi:hypothetical protein